MMIRYSLIVGSIVVFISAYVIGSNYFQSFTNNEIKNSHLLVREYSPTFGPEDAPVELVEFLDPECEACRAFHPFVKKILSENDGKIRYVVRYAPFHGNSQLVVRVLEAARLQNKYWETLDLLFLHQPKWGSHHTPQVDVIWEFLPQLDLDIEQLKKDMSRPTITEIIQQDIEDGVALKIRGTPTFFINKKSLKKFGFEELQMAIEDEL